MMYCFFTDNRFLKSVLLFFTYLAIFLSSYGQSEKEVIKKYAAALQKAADPLAVKSVELQGTITIQKINLPVVIYSRPPHIRIEMKFQNLTFLQIGNDSVKWEYNPMNETNKLTRTAKETGNRASENSSFDYVNNDLLQYEKLDHKATLKGREKVDSLNVFVLELVKVNKKKIKFLINDKTYLIYKVEDEKGLRYFANYTSSNGYVFPKYIKEINSKEQVEMQFNKLSFNKELDDALFTIPLSAYEQEATTNNSAPFAIADSLYKIGKFEEAAQYYSEVIEGDKTNEYAYNARGLSKIGMKEYYDAIADFNIALQINPKSANARNNIGLAKYYLGDHAGAIKDYTKALELNPEFVVTYKNRGLVYYEGGKYDLAIEDYDKATKLDPKDGGAHFSLGLAFAQINKDEEALRSYALASAHEYHGASLYNFKGVSEYKLEKFDSARVSFEKALTLDKGNLQYLENYGRSLYELGKPDEASVQFNEYLKKQPDNASIHNMNGLCKFQMEDFKGAIQDFTKCIDLNGKEATYYDNRAAAREQIENYDGAILDYTESIKIYPSDASVFYKRGMLKIHTSKKLEGCLDLATANEMKYQPANDAILKNCH